MAIITARSRGRTLGRALRLAIFIAGACLGMVALWAFALSTPGSASATFLSSVNGSGVKSLTINGFATSDSSDRSSAGFWGIGGQQRHQQADARDFTEDNAKALKAFIAPYLDDKGAPIVDPNATAALNGVIIADDNDVDSAAVAGAGATDTPSSPSIRGGDDLLNQGASSSEAAPVIKGTSALFLSFHEGTAVDFNYVARKLGIERVEWKYPRTFKLYSKFGGNMYNMPYRTAIDIWRAFEREACQSYDWIVVSDTIPVAGRAYIEGLLGLDSDYASGGGAPANVDSGVFQVCKAKVILQATTRFDYNHLEDVSYHASFQLAVSRGLVTVIANNPFEEWYMHIKRVTVPGGVPVIRPHGQGWKEWQMPDDLKPTAAEAAAPAAAERNYSLPAVVAKRDTELPLVQLLNQTDIKFELLNELYGGPFGLAKYRCLIHSPYQVSTMSLYENLAAGVVIFVPELPLLKALHTYRELWVPEHLIPEGIPWDLVDWYAPYFDTVLIKFSSANHLRQLLETTDFEAQRRRILDFMTLHEKLTLEQWRRVLFNGRDGYSR